MNTIQKLYAGNYSLAKSYWLFTIIGSWIMAGICYASIYAIALNFEITKPLFLVIILLTMASVAYTFIAMVGTWRSASKSESGWRRVVMGLIILGFINVSTSILSAAAEFANIYATIN